jgi:nitrogen fixation protein NifU and related proteins
MSETNEIYQQMILEHNKKPRNFKKMDAPTHQAEGYNPLCGDHFNVYLRVDANKNIEELSFEGAGCAISKASASMMTTELKGKSTAHALEAFEDFHQLLLGKGGDAEKLGKLKVFSGIWKYPSRVKCASLSWHAMKNAITGSGSAKTE